MNTADLIRRLRLAASDEYGGGPDVRLLCAEAAGVIERAEAVLVKYETYKGPLGMAGSPLFGAGMAEAYKDLTARFREALSPAAPASSEKP